MFTVEVEDLGTKIGALILIDVECVLNINISALLITKLVKTRIDLSEESSWAGVFCKSESYVNRACPKLSQIKGRTGGC